MMTLLQARPVFATFVDIARRRDSSCNLSHFNLDVGITFSSVCGFVLYACTFRLAQRNKPVGDQSGDLRGYNLDDC